MRQWIVITILLLLLVGGGVFAGVRIFDLTKQVYTLNYNYATLLSNYNTLNSNYQVLQSSYNTLKSDFESLKSDYDSLQSDYYQMQGRMDELESRNSELRAENQDLQRQLDQYEKVPHAYYYRSSFLHHSNTYEELCQFLTYEFKIPRDYELGIFDCSESAAYLEWALETAGFDARIVVGPTPWNPASGYHAWVIAYPEGYRVAIEPTALSGEYILLELLTGRTPGIIYGNDPVISCWQNYYEGYDDQFKNIYIAIGNSGRLEEWNWWEGFWGFT